MVSDAQAGYTPMVVISVLILVLMEYGLWR